MNPLLPVLPLPREGGSGKGNSYYTKAIFCPRCVNLDEQAGTKEDSPRGAAAEGTMFHQMAELYYKGASAEPHVIPISDVNWGDAITEARRVWASFIAKHPGVDHWGNVVAVEEKLPRNEEEAAAIKELMGVEYTLKPDLVVQLTIESLDRIKHLAPDLALPPAGSYILLDWKTKGKADADAPLLYAQSDQFASYVACWNAVDTRQANGTLVVEPISTKEVKFRYFFVSPPDETTMKVVRTKMANGAALVQTNAALGVAHGCRSYNRWCHHHPYVGGSCTRY